MAYRFATSDFRARVEQGIGEGCVSAAVNEQ
jgi:hypothetical protein